MRVPGSITDRPTGAEAYGPMRPVIVPLSGRSPALEKGGASFEVGGDLLMEKTSGCVRGGAPHGRGCARRR
jgi:hypothetical protein